MPRDGSLPPPQVHVRPEGDAVVLSEELAETLGRMHFHIRLAVGKLEKEDPAFAAAR